MPFSVARNTTLIITAMVAQKVLATLFYVFGIAKFFSLDDVGKFLFATSLITVFSIFIDLGLNTFLTREFSRGTADRQSYFGGILRLKIILAILATIAVVITVNILKPSDLLVRQLVYLALIIMNADAFSSTFFAVLRGSQSFVYESIGMVASQVVLVIVGIGVIWGNLSVLYLMLALAASSLFNLVLSVTVILIKKINWRLNIPWANLRPVVLIAFSFAMAGIFTRLYAYFDAILVSKIVGDQGLAWYGTAAKIVNSLTFIPAAFGMVLFAAFSSDFSRDRQDLGRGFTRAMYYLILTAVPLSAGLIILAKEVVFLINPEYFNAIIPLQILSLSLIFVFLNYPCGALLNACNEHKKYTVFWGITVLFNVIANLIFIPFSGIVAASVVALLSSIIIVVLPWRAVTKIIQYDRWLIIAGLSKSFGAVIFMGLVIFILKFILPLLIVVPVGVVVYLVGLIAFQAVGREDWEYFKQSLKLN